MVRVARQQVREALLDEEQPGVVRPPAEAPVDRRCGDLDERSRLDQRAQPLGRGLHLPVSLRVGEHRCDTERSQPEDGLRQLSGHP